MSTKVDLQNLVMNEDNLHKLKKEQQQKEKYFFTLSTTIIIKLILLKNGQMYQVLMNFYEIHLQLPQVFSQILLTCIFFLCSLITYFSNQQHLHFNQKLQVPDQDEADYGKKTLVLDLDETLVHSSFYNKNADFQLQLRVKTSLVSIFVTKRPFAQQFISALSDIFEIIIFTASLKEYALPTIEEIDRDNKIKIKLFRENCTWSNGMLVKDLANLNRNLKDIILIDNSAYSCIFQPENSIVIKSFIGDLQDSELEKYIPFLNFLSKLNDIRSVPNYEQLFFQNTPFEIKNQQNQMIYPTQFINEWQKIKQKQIEERYQNQNEEEIYIDTPQPKETQNLLKKDSELNAKFSFTDKITIKARKESENHIQQNNIQKNLTERPDSTYNQKHMPNTPPKLSPLKFDKVRTSVANNNLNSPIMVKQDKLAQSFFPKEISKEL